MSFIDLDNWATFLLTVFVIGGLFLYFFTTALFTVLMGLALMFLVLTVLYYVGHRIHNRLLHGKRSGSSSIERIQDGELGGSNDR